MRSTNKTQPPRRQASVFSGEPGQGGAAGLESYKEPRASRTQEEAKSTPHIPVQPAGMAQACVRTAYPGRCLLPALLSAVFALCTKDYPC